MSGMDATSTEQRRRTQGEQLAKAVNWIVNGQIFADVRVHGNANWVPLHLVQVAVLWVWSSKRLLVESAEDVIKDAQKLFDAGGIESYQTLVGALKKYTEQILPPLRARIQQLMEKTDQANSRLDGSGLRQPIRR